MLGLLFLARDRGVDVRHLVQQGLVVRAVPGLVEVELVIERLLVQERQESDSPAQERLAVLADRGGGKRGRPVSGEVVHGEAHDPEIFGSWPGPRGQARRLGRCRLSLRGRAASSGPAAPAGGARAYSCLRRRDRPMADGVALPPAASRPMPAATTRSPPRPPRSSSVS